MNKENHVWVVIETNKGINKTYTFGGKVLKTDFNKLIKGKFKKTIIKLENTYWCDVIEEDRKILYTMPGEEQLCDYTHHNFSGHYYIVARNITLMAILKDGSEYFKQIEKIKN